MLQRTPLEGRGRKKILRAKGQWVACNRASSHISLSSLHLGRIALSHPGAIRGGYVTYTGQWKGQSQLQCPRGWPGQPGFQDKISWSRDSSWPERDTLYKGEITSLPLSKWGCLVLQHISAHPDWYRPNASEGSFMQKQEKSFPGRRAKCKGPGAEACSACSRKIKRPYGWKGVGKGQRARDKLWGCGGYCRILTPSDREATGAFWAETWHLMYFEKIPLTAGEMVKDKGSSQEMFRKHLGEKLQRLRLGLQQWMGKTWVLEVL